MRVAQPTPRNSCFGDSAMYTGKLVFAQVMDHLPLHSFRRCVARYRGEHKATRIWRRFALRRSKQCKLGSPLVKSLERWGSTQTGYSFGWRCTERVDGILFTHAHRDQCQGFARAVEAGIPLYFPEASRQIIDPALRSDWRPPLPRASSLSRPA